MKIKKIYYYILLALLIAAGTSIFLYSRYGIIKRVAIEAEKTKTVAYVLNRTTGFVHSEDFGVMDTKRQQQIFNNFWKSIQSPELIRIKIWDKNFTVIWSNLSELIGQRFPENHEVGEALDGEVEFEIEKQKREHISERQYEELSETYIPFANTDGEVVGVFEVYQPIVKLNQEIKNNFWKIAVPTVFAAIGGYLILVLTLRFFLKVPMQ